MNLKINKKISLIVKAALEEDDFSKDITSESIGLKDNIIESEIISREEGILCGVEYAYEAFMIASNTCTVEVLKTDGEKINKDDIIMNISGEAPKILSAERTALNFISYMSGIASYTEKFVEIVKRVNSNCSILDTRKTHPGLREIEKYAVKTGGGENHRVTLSEMVLLKENHLNLSGKNLKETVNTSKKNVGMETLVEVEVETLEEFLEALDSDADIIMLDNFNLEMIEKAVNEANKKQCNKKIEVSGGVGLDNVAEITKTGVDRISIGKLTSSVRGHDFSMLVKNYEK